MMKRLLLMIMALCVLLCIVGCSGVSEGPTVVTPATTEGTSGTTTTTFVKKTDDANKAAEARIDFSSLVGMLNICNAYGSPLPVYDSDTISDISERFRSTGDGTVIELNGIDLNARFFDYAMKNPDYSEGGDLYILREDADWVALSTK